MNIFFAKIRHNSTKGQSLVELAIIAPLLIFFLLGIFEVGWALRSYLVLVNVNREITRFAVRPGYMNFSTISDTVTSFDSVKSWARSSVGEQLDLEFDTVDAVSTLIISHIVVDTGLPCEDISTCDCNKFDPDHASYDSAYGFVQDDLIIHPNLAGYDYQQERFGPTETVTGIRDTRIDFAGITQNLKDNNNKFNCLLMKKNGVPSANNVIVTELFHDQPQLFGFPLISNPFTDPVPLYTHTTMRLINAARSTGGVEGSIVANIDNIGQVCLAYPMLVADDVVHNQNVNIVANGWLRWGNSITGVDEDYINYALQYPQMSLNDYSGGLKANVSDVDKVAGPFSGVITQTVAGLANKSIIIPTANSADIGNDPVRITGFVYVTIDGSTLDVPNNVIMARVDKDTELPGSCL